MERILISRTLKIKAKTASSETIYSVISSILVGVDTRPASPRLLRLAHKRHNPSCSDVLDAIFSFSLPLFHPGDHAASLPGFNFLSVFFIRFWLASYPYSLAFRTGHHDRLQKERLGRGSSSTTRPRCVSAAAWQGAQFDLHMPLHLDTAFCWRTEHQPCFDENRGACT